VTFVLLAAVCRRRAARRCAVATGAAKLRLADRSQGFTTRCVVPRGAVTRLVVP
jgi:hypothetical protein